MSNGKKNIDMKAIEQIALSVRSLAMDGVQKAKSGHPGLPMGCAEIGAVVYAHILSHYPADPDWINRDRFILSAGHGSMLLYSLLHLSGYGLSLDEIKKFRQLGSKTPGHPEYGRTPGVETTTGPLGQGVSNAVGMAIAEKMLGARFNTDTYKIIDHYTYVLASDGDLMEGLSSEASSLAGHLGLGKLIMFYDSNSITIEGSTDIAFSEDVAQRFTGFKWHVQKGSAYDIRGIVDMVENAKEEKDKPSIIILESVIGKGSANLEGSEKSHGAPLGDEEVAATKKVLGIPVDSFFYVHPGAIEYFNNYKKELQQDYNLWNEQFAGWQKDHPDLAALWQKFFGPVDLSGVNMPNYAVGDVLATRAASGQVLNAIAEGVPNLLGGSADLAPSNNTHLKGAGDFQVNSPLGRNMHFGVREHAMGGIMNGMTLHKGLRTFGATFMIFSDYVRPSIRLACLMKIPVIYIFTHDSIFVGEDGPTHQPVEQITGLRIIPELLDLRPGDAEETVCAWEMAMKHKDGPAALILTRQKLKVYEKEDQDWKKNILNGAYIVKDSKQDPEIVIIASGSEVSLALAAASHFPDKHIRTISMISYKLFQKQPSSYIQKLLPPGAKRICVEAGIGMCWGKFTRDGDKIISIEHFGESGPGKEVGEHCGMSEQALRKVIEHI